jgi:hypothetical protein
LWSYCPTDFRAVRSRPIPAELPTTPRTKARIDEICLNRLYQHENADVVQPIGGPDAARGILPQQSVDPGLILVD